MPWRPRKGALSLAAVGAGVAGEGGGGVVRSKVAVVTGGGKGLGYHISYQLLVQGFSVVIAVHDDDEETRRGIEKKMELEGFKGRFHVVPMDVKKVKSISAAAAKIQEAFPDGVDCLVNNAALHPDGFSYDIAQEVLDVNFFGAQNVIRRLVPARWPEAFTGAWLPAKSGYKGMRKHGCVINIVCRSSFSSLSPAAGGVSGIAAPFQAVQGMFETCTSETAIVMKLTEYLGHVAAGTHINAGWPSNPYLVSKVALEKLTGIVNQTFKTLSSKQYEEDLSCLSLDPGWVSTAMGGPEATTPVEDGARLVVRQILLNFNADENKK